MADMTGPEIYRMVLDMNGQAAGKGGKMVDLALPQEMFDDLIKYTLSIGLPLNPDYSVTLDGVRIHTGDSD